MCRLALRCSCPSKYVLPWKYLESCSLIRVSPQLPAGVLARLREKGHRAGHILGAEIVVLQLIVLERDRLEAVDGNRGLRGAAQPENGPIASIGGHKTRHQHHHPAQQPTLHPVPAFLERAGVILEGYAGQLQASRALADSFA